MYRIGILQLTQNLDDAVQGFKYGLQEQGIAAEYHYFNADGNVQELPKLAENLKNLNVDLIFACSTPAAKTAVNAAPNIPVIFTPVFDPVGSGLITSMDKPGGNATGVAGMVKAADKVTFIHELLPTAKTVGVLYHDQDSNSLLELKYFLQAAETNFDVIEAPIRQPEDLSKLPDLISAAVDVLFVPIGKIVEENFASIVYYADGLNLPIVASHAPNVPAGALAGLVADHRKLGIACSKQAAAVLKGANPADISVGIVDEPDILLNSYAAQNLDIELPASLVERAKEIYE